MANKETRIIAVANEKGGVGKTVTVVNLAAALAKNDKSVLVVDMDPQAAATRGLGIELEDGIPSVYDMITDKDTYPVDTVILKSKWKGIDVLPSDADLAGAEVELVEEEGRENKLKEALEDLNGDYDFILIDTPPSLSLLTVNVFVCAKEVVVPCQTHPYAYSALSELFDTVEAVREEINPGLKISGVLATLYDGRTRVGQNILAKLKTEENTRDLMFNTVIRANTKIAESADVGKPVVYYRTTSFGAIDYRALAEEIQALS